MSGSEKTHSHAKCLPERHARKRIGTAFRVPLPGRLTLEAALSTKPA
jgi:hypothetical protein